MEKMKLECRGCGTIFVWPDDQCRIADDTDLDALAVICPGNESKLIASHCEILGKDGKPMPFKDRFYILKKH
tara:strand:+ start:59 stop:274 length:216 start_codon:yes stop_codon:yes gene_type:complete